MYPEFQIYYFPILRTQTRNQLPKTNECSTRTSFFCGMGSRTASLHIQKTHVIFSD